MCLNKFSNITDKSKERINNYISEDVGKLKQFVGAEPVFEKKKEKYTIRK